MSEVLLYSLMAVVVLLSVVSVALHAVRKTVAPPTSSAVLSELSAFRAELASQKERLQAFDLSLTDLADRVSHWMRRQSVRRLRAAQETKEPSSEQHQSESDRKADLRKRAYSRTEA